MRVQHCTQGTSLVKRDSVGIRGEQCLARSPPSRNCHVGCGLLPLSFAPTGCRSGASVGSHCRLLQLSLSMEFSYTMYDSQHTCDLTTHA
ncbi:hypothetical protein PBY51_004096 [Eleginops maclovinus]|uniref:Uncharacterized protein n=1 Tax=Eleginops maclovinus TaxID=56733 RepID=A0AAN7Y337_ELEMC|nr:hypothetical protein PBY51_004096 [Eleginops maclovinus]